MMGRFVLTGSVAEDGEVVGNDFGNVAFVTVFVFPGAGLEFPFDVYLSSFAEYFFGDLGQSTPTDDVVPFCLFDAFAIAVFSVFGGGQGERSLFHHVRSLVVLVYGKCNHIGVLS